MVARVHADADGGSQQPVVGQRFRPEGIDLEDGGLDLRRGRCLEGSLARADADDQQDERPADHVVYHAVDLEKFDGKLDNPDSNLILHDGRSEHKGSRLYPRLQAAFPAWRFEALDCAPEAVADRMRGARAFFHLSRYEGNSIVCNEAMAMDLPCLFTKVGLMLDGAEQFDVATLSAFSAFSRRRVLHERVESFLASLSERDYRPRKWVTEHASAQVNRSAWQRVLDDFDVLEWG